MMAVLVALVWSLQPEPKTTVVNVSPQLNLDAEQLGRAIVKGAMQESRREMETRGGVGRFEAEKVECMNNVRNIVGLLVVGGEFPKKYSGANFISTSSPWGRSRARTTSRISFAPAMATRALTSRVEPKPTPRWI